MVNHTSVYLDVALLCQMSEQTDQQSISEVRGVVTYMSCVEAFVTGIKSPFGGPIKGSR